MKRGWFFLNICMILAISQSVFGQTETSKLSNQLPTAFVQQLIADGLWKADYDNSNTASGKDLQEFWSELIALPQEQDPTQAAKLSETLIDRLFGYLTRTTADPKSTSGSEVPSENLYPIKFKIVRFLLEPTDDTGRPITLDGSIASLMPRLTPALQEFRRRWLNRYLDMAIALINIGGIEDYKPIVKDFQQKLIHGQIEIKDLSPAERARLRNEIATSHGVAIDAKVKLKGSTPNYRVVGLYNNEKNYLALDFARPTEDTLTTFSHEIVHASDPRLATYRETYKKLFPEVRDILLKWSTVSDPNAAQIWNQLDFLGAVKNAFEQSDLEADYKMKQDQRAMLIGKIKSDLANQMDEIKQRAQQNNKIAALPTTEEMQTVRTWLRALIGLTVENEYRAQGLSIELQATLTAKTQLLFPTENLKRYVDRFAAGDSAYAFYLSQETNPMPKFRSSILQAIDGRTDDTATGIKMSVGVLQVLYYDETQLFIEGLDQGPVANRFSKALSSLNIKEAGLDDLNPETDDDILPEWSQPGKYGLPTNPHQLISAIPTTAWIYGYRQRLASMEVGLRKLMEPVLNWRAQILDLSDLSLEDAKRVGIFEEKFSISELPLNVYDPQKTIQDNPILQCLLNTNKDSLVKPDVLDRYLKAVNWSELPSKSAKTIRGEDLMSNLIGHRLIRAHAMLSRLYPVLRNDIVAIKILDEKLQTRMFLRDGDFPDDRIASLRNEITFMQDNLSIDIKNDILRMGVLLDSVSKAFEAFAFEQKWQPLASAFSKLNRRIISNLESDGVFGGKNIDETSQEMIQSTNSIKNQLKPYAEHCAKRPKKDSYEIFAVGDAAPRIKVDKSDFPLMLTCYDGLLFAVRQPCDFTQFMTRWSELKSTAREQTDGTENPDLNDLEAYIFYGSRGILLMPVQMQQETLKSVTEPAAANPSKRKWFFK